MEKCSDKMRELIEDYVEARCKGWALVGCDLTRDENNKLGIRVTQTYKALEAAIGTLEADCNLTHQVHGIRVRECDALAAGMAEARTWVAFVVCCIKSGEKLSERTLKTLDNFFAREPHARVKRVQALEKVAQVAGLLIKFYDENNGHIVGWGGDTWYHIQQLHKALAEVEAQKGDEVEQDE